MAPFFVPQILLVVNLFPKDIPTANSSDKNVEHMIP